MEASAAAIAAEASSRAPTGTGVAGKRKRREILSRGVSDPLQAVRDQVASSPSAGAITPRTRSMAIVWLQVWWCLK